MKFRKKPVVIDAIQWNGINLTEIKEFVGGSLNYEIHDAAWQVGKGRPRVRMTIHTLEGDHACTEGDYIIKGVAGEFYPCKPDIFAQTYEHADAPTVDAVEVEWKDGTPPDMTGQDRVWIIAEIPSLFNPDVYRYDTFAWLDGGGWNEKAVSRATRWTHMPMPCAKMGKAVEG